MKKLVVIFLVLISANTYGQHADTLQKKQKPYYFAGRLFGRPIDNSWLDNNKYSAGAYGIVMPDFQNQENLRTPCPDYIEIDSAGFDLIRNDFRIPYREDYIINRGDRRNARVCRLSFVTDEVLEFTPQELLGYRVRCRHYVAKDISLNGIQKRLFLEVLARNNATIYYIKDQKKHFFLEKDGILTELVHTGQENDYKQLLQDAYGDCQYTKTNLKDTKLRKNSLKNFAEGYQKCQNIYKPIRFGAFAGLGPINLPYLENHWSYSDDNQKAESFSAGLFCDIPIAGKLESFYVEAFYTKGTIDRKFNKQSPNQKDAQDAAEIEMLTIPVMLRLYIGNKKLQPYLNGGVSYSFYWFRQKITHLDGTNTDEVGSWKDFPQPHNISLLGGIGLSYKLTDRNAIFIEGRGFMTAKIAVETYGFGVFTGVTF